MNNNEIDKAIEEGLAEIDKETMEDEEIREIARLLKDELVRQTQIRVTDLNGNWQLTYQISSDKRDDSSIVSQPNTLLDLVKIMRKYEDM